MRHEEPSEENLRNINLILSDYHNQIGENKILQEDAKDHQNVYFCFEKDDVVVMDNHRCALWFWKQKIKEDLVYNILHIDTHYDLAELRHGTNVSREKIHNLSFSDYLNYKDNVNDTYLYFNWANYILPFINCYQENVKNLYLVVNQDADEPPVDLKSIKCHVEDSKGYDALRSLENLYNGKENWIVNFDIDFFFKYDIQFYSDQYMDMVLKEVKKFKDLENTILTIALSPSCCGGWENSIKVLEKMRLVGII